MKRMTQRIAAIMLTLGTLLAFSPTVGAYQLLKDACASGVTVSSATCSQQNQQETIYGTNGLLARITKVVAIVAGIASIIMIVISGLFFVTAEGDPAKIKSARSSLIGAIIGIVIVLAAQGIITFVLSNIK